MSGSILQSLFHGPSDEEQMWRVRTNDDPAAFARLMAGWQGPVRRLCERMLGDSHRAEDLTQEAFVRVFGHRRNYQQSAKFSTFLWRIALNLCYDELRKLRRRNESSLDAGEPDGLPVLSLLTSAEPPPDEQAMEDERAELVRKALLGLSVAHRTVVVMRHYEDLKFREIAEILELPEGTVKSRMAEAMTQLQQLLKLQKEDYQPKRQESLII